MSQGASVLCIDLDFSEMLWIVRIVADILIGVEISFEHTYEEMVYRGRAGYRAQKEFRLTRGLSRAQPCEAGLLPKLARPPQAGRVLIIAHRRT